MANSKSNIYPVALQNAELNLNKYDAEIKQYSGFNKNNAPFVGGCLSNIFTKNETITDATKDNVYIDDNGDVYQVTDEGLFKNGNKVIDTIGKNFYDIEEIQLEKNTIYIYDDYFYVYYIQEGNVLKFYVKFYDFVTEEWHNELFYTLDKDKIFGISVNAKCLKYDDNNFSWILCFCVNNKYIYYASVRHNELFSSYISEEYELITGRPQCNTILGVYATENKIYISLNPDEFGRYLISLTYTFNADDITITPNVEASDFMFIQQHTSLFSYDFSLSKIANVEICIGNRLYFFNTGSFIIQITYCNIAMVYENGAVKFVLTNPYEIPGLTGNNSEQNYDFLKYGVVSTFKSDAMAFGGCDYVTAGVYDNKITTGIVFNDIILMNNDTVTGLTLPDTSMILITDWNSVDEDFIFIPNKDSNYYYHENNVVVYYKTYSDKKIYKVIKSNEPKLKKVLDQIVINCDSVNNSYDTKRDLILLYAPSWNNRWPTKTVLSSVSTYFASSINEYNLDLNASLLLNPVPIEGGGSGISDKYKTNINSLINLYRGATKVGYVNSYIDGTTYQQKQLIGLQFPIDANGNVQLSPSLFADVKNIYGNQSLIKDGNTYYPLMIGNDNKTIMSFYLASGVEGLENGFILQGQFYGIINKGIYSIQYVNGVIGNIQFVVSVENLQFCGNTPYEALFYSKTNRCLYSFTGANILQVKQIVDKISIVKAYKYNPATQSIFLLTDIGVLVSSLFGIYCIDMPEAENMFLLDNGVVLCDNNGHYRYIRYYKEDTDEDYLKENIKLETCFYGMDNQTVTINDCLYMRLFSEEHEEGAIEVAASTISLKGRTTEKTTFHIKKADWDKETHTIYLRYQPKEQRGLGISFRIESPFKIASMSVGSQPDAILVDKVSKGAVNAPFNNQSSTIEW